MTGPVALMEATEAYAKYAGANVTVLAPGMVFAYNWHQVREWQAATLRFLSSRHRIV